MLIGLAHKKLSGKDEVGWYLAQQYGSTRLAFADHLKDVVGSTFGFTYEQMHGRHKDIIDPDWGFAPSYALQVFGTEVARTLHPQVWVRALKRKLRKLPRYLNQHVTDVRFPDEAAMIKSLGGFIVEVRSPVEQREHRAVSAGVDLAEFRKRCSHESETALDGYQFDAVIVNDSSISELQRRTDEVVLALQALAG